MCQFFSISLPLMISLSLRKLLSRRKKDSDEMQIIKSCQMRSENSPFRWWKGKKCEKDGEMASEIVKFCSSIPTYTFEYDIIFFSVSYTSTSRPQHVQSRWNENNACKVGQSNETTILSAISSTTEGRSEIAVFPSFFVFLALAVATFMVWELAFSVLIPN